MSPTPTSGPELKFLLLRLIKNYVIVKKSSKIYGNSFRKNRLLEFWSKALIASILKLFKNEDYAHYQNMISRKSLLRIIAENYENCHLCSSIKYWHWKLFSKSRESSRQIPKAWVLNMDQKFLITLICFI